MKIHEALALVLRHLPATLDMEIRDRELSLRQVAAQSGLTLSVVHRLCNDPDYDPRLSTVVKALDWISSPTNGR